VRINNINRLKQIFLKVVLIPKFFVSLSVKTKKIIKRGKVISPLKLVSDTKKFQKPTGTNIFTMTQGYEIPIGPIIPFRKNPCNKTPKNNGDN